MVVTFLEGKRVVGWTLFDPELVERGGERPRVGVASMVIKGGKVLLGKRRGSHGAGSWGTPGGHLEYGETVEGCAKRELFEETGLIAKSMTCGPYTNDIFTPSGKHYITLFVFVTDFEGTLTCCEPKKCEGWKWFMVEEFPSPLLTSLAGFIQEFGIDVLRKLGR